MDPIIGGILNNTLCVEKPHLTRCFDIEVVRGLCEDDEEKKRLFCTFPLMNDWIAGVLSVVILAITYFAEVITTLVSDKFDHYFEIFSGKCCRKHNKGMVIVCGFILPLSQQMSTLVYEHWIKTFAHYWKSANKNLGDSSSWKPWDCAKTHHAEVDLIEKSCSDPITTMAG